MRTSRLLHAGALVHIKDGKTPGSVREDVGKQIGLTPSHITPNRVFGIEACVENHRNEAGDVLSQSERRNKEVHCHKKDQRKQVRKTLTRKLHDEWKKKIIKIQGGTGSTIPLIKQSASAVPRATRGNLYAWKTGGHLKRDELSLRPAFPCLNA